MSSVTVVSADDCLSPKVADVLGRWVEGGVCRPFLFVTTSRDHPAESRSLPAIYHSTSGLEEVDLFGWMAKNHRTTIRLVTLHVVAGDVRADAATLVERDVQLGYRVKPLLGVDQQFVHLNLFVPGAGVSDIPLGAARMDVSLNLVVAPEDRAAPGTFGFPLEGRGDGTAQFVTHAAVNLAAVGALWTQMDEGPFDDASQMAGVREVQVVRSFLRLLDGPDPLPDLISVALNPTDDSGRLSWPSPSASNTTEAGSAGPFLKHATEDAISLGERMFDFRLPPRPHRPVQETVSIWTAIKMLGSFLWERIRNAIPEKLALVRNDVTRRVNRLGQALVGEDSQLLVRFGGQLTIDDVVAPPLDTDQLADAALTVVDLVDGLERYLAPAQGPEWDSIRTAMFALVDGSTMPQGFQTPSMGDKRPVILDVSLLASHPDTAPLVVSGIDAGLPNQGRITLTAFDPYATDRLLAHVEGLRPADEETTRTRLALVRQLRDWRAQRSRSLLWKIGSYLGDQIDSARVQMVSALRIVQAGRPRAADDALQAEAKRAFRWILISVGVALALALAATLSLPAAGIGFGIAMAVVAVIVVGWVCAVIWRHLQYLHFSFKVRYQRAQAVSDFEQAVEDVIACSRELIRLGSLYWQYERWAEISAHLLHRPWGVKPVDHQDETVLTIDDPPMSCRVGSALLDTEKLKPIAASLRSAIFVVGWLRTAFREAEEFAMERVAIDQALDQTPSMLEDRLQASNRSLDEFLKVLRAGQHWQATMASRSGDAEAEVLTRRPAEMFEKVVLADGSAYPDATAGRDADPLDGLLLELLAQPNASAPDPLGSFGESITRLGGAPVIERSLVARPNPLGLNQPYEGLIEQPMAPSWRPRRLLFSAVRVDAAGSTEPRDLTFFAEPPANADHQRRAAEIAARQVGEGD